MIILRKFKETEEKQSDAVTVVNDFPFWLSKSLITEINFT